MEQLGGLPKLEQNAPDRSETTGMVLNSGDSHLYSMLFAFPFSIAMIFFLKSIQCHNAIEKNN